MKRIVLLMVLMFVAASTALAHPPPPPKGTAAELTAGTETKPRIWSPTILATQFAGAAAEVVDEAVTAATGDSDTAHGYSQNAIIDYLMATIDPDGDGSIADSSLTITALTVGALAGVDSIDATGAVDMDYGSADVTDHTFVSDGGTVILDGSVETTGDVTGGVLTTSKAADYTIGTDAAREAYGGTVYVTSAATITAPAIADGMSFTVITIGATAVSVDVNAADLMYLDGTALADGDKATNTSTTGDMLTCQYYSAVGWYCMSGSPDGDHWTDGN